MNKIIVIGCPGSGKSTFSRELNKITAIPLHHLDNMYWNADKTVVEKQVFLDRLSSVLDKNEWIIDGNYASTMELRIRACDTVIFLDYSANICLEGIRQRRGKVRSDMPWVEADKDDEEFIEFIKNYKEQNRPKVMELLQKYSYKDIHIFSNREKEQEFLSKLK